MRTSPLELLRSRPTGIPMSAGCEERLAAQLESWYGEPRRHYHSWGHIVWCLDQLEALVEERAGIEHTADVFVALLFHDAVYDPSRKDNEAVSARLAREHASTVFPTADLDRVERLILLTARHGRLALEELTMEERLFLDVDTSVLGGEEAAYRAYADGVRREYEPSAGRVRYTLGRKAFLMSLLAAPRIFLSDRYRGRLEARARENVKRELLGL